MSVTNKSINKNNHGINRAGPAELATDSILSPIAAPAAGDAMEPCVVLDDLAPPVLPKRSPASSDLKLLRAMQSILDKRQTDAWIDDMRAQISSELEWDEA
jgi:hypothetical protein